MILLYLLIYFAESFHYTTDKNNMQCHHLQTLLKRLHIKYGRLSYGKIIKHDITV